MLGVLYYSLGVNGKLPVICPVLCSRRCNIKDIKSLEDLIFTGVEPAFDCFSLRNLSGGCVTVVSGRTPVAPSWDAGDLFDVMTFPSLILSTKYLALPRRTSFGSLKSKSKTNSLLTLLYKQEY